MKLNLLAQIKKLDGSAFEIKSKDGKDLSFKQFLITCILHDFKDANESLTSRLFRYDIAKKINNEPFEVSLSRNEAELIIEAASKLLSTEAFGSFCQEFSALE